MFRHFSHMHMYKYTHLHIYIYILCIYIYIYIEAAWTYVIGKPHFERNPDPTPRVSGALNQAGGRWVQACMLVQRKA